MADKESLENILLLEMSRRNTDMVVDLISQKPELFDEIFLIFLRNEEPVSRRAAWVIDTYTIKRSELLAPYLPKILEKIRDFNHDGMKRHSLSMFAKSQLPCDDHLGILMNICFDWLLSPHEAVAAKVYCMEILYRISQIEPDLKKELADTIELRLSEEMPGVKNRGEKLLKRLYAEIEALKGK
ncbi:MAG: hypothetical protein NT004_14360 [Bacteroidetes bacterium]|nr:hypothetical protein [Bacteroidota bacterium]